MSAVLFLIAAILALLGALGVAAPRVTLGWLAVCFIALGLMLANGVPSFFR